MNCGWTTRALSKRWAAFPVLGAALVLFSCGGDTADTSNETVGTQEEGLSGQTITNSANGLVIADAGYSTSNSTQYVQWSYDGGWDDYFQLSLNSDGAYTITNTGSQKCMDDLGWSNTTGAPIGQYTCNGYDNQRWYLDSVGSGVYHIRSKYSGLCASFGSSSSNGTGLVQQTCGGSGQTFKIALSGGGSGGTDPVLAVVGDIANSGGSQSAVASLIKSSMSNATYVVTLGDNVYGGSFDVRTNCHGTSEWAQGTWEGYTTLLDPSFSSLKSKMLPAPGNHDYGNFDSNTASGCDGQGRIHEGYISYYNGSNSGYTTKAVTTGGTTWNTLHYGIDILTASGKKYRYISVNSGDCFYSPYTDANCGTSSSEYAWLKSELANHLKISNGGTYSGILIGTHFNRWDSGGCGAGNSGQTHAFMELAYDYKVDLFLSGHVHNYERFGAQAKYPGSTSQSNCSSPLTGPVADSAGPTEINVGTGGTGLSGLSHPWALSKARATEYGVLRVTLHDTAIAIDFRDTTNTSLDSASIPLH